MSNNNIVDASSSPKNITVGGSVQQGAFSPHVAGGYSYRFSTGSDFLTFDATSADISGDFTIEFWKFRKLSDSPIVFNIRLNATNNFQVVEGSTQNKIFYMGTSTVNSISSALSVSGNDWDHYAVVRSSGVVKVYLNGSPFSTEVTTSDDFSASSITIGSMGSGGFENGYVSDFRISSSAKYSSSFTAPTSPFFFEADTELLSANKSYITGQSYLADSLTGSRLDTTINGAVYSDRFTPYDIPLYSADSSGGSARFTTDSDQITVDASSIDLSGDFTIETWVRPESLDSDGSVIFDNRENVGDNNIIRMSLTSQVAVISTGSNSATSTIDGPDFYKNWNHLAVVRSSDQISRYINGKLVGTAISNSSDLSKNNLYIGNSPNGGSFKGYMSDFRVSSSAIYTDSFSLPGLLTSSTDTQLLLDFNDATIIDKTGSNFLNVQGDVASVTDAPYTDGTSLSFDGDGDYVKVEDARIALTGDYTVEARIKPESVYGRYDLTPDLENAQAMLLDATDTTTATSTVWTNSTQSTLITAPEAVQYGFANVSIVSDASSNQIGYTLGNTSTVTISTYANIGTMSGNHPELVGFTGQSSSAFSISGWFKTTTSVSTTTDGEIGQGFTGDDLQSTVAAIGFNNGYPEFIANDGASWMRATAGGGIADGDWHHVVWVHDNGQITIYIDGSLSGAASQPAIFAGGIFKVDYLGRIATSNYNGDVAGLRLFTNALSSQDVEVVHDANAPTYNRNYLTTSGGSGAQQLVQFSNGAGISLLHNNLVLNDGSSDIITSSAELTSSDWQHVAVSRESGTVRMFVDGVSSGSVSSSSEFGAFGVVYVGADSAGENAFSGNLTDVRITKNAVYTSNFSVPTSSYGIDATPV